MSTRSNSTPEEILDITFNLIAEHDISGVTVDKVAEIAGVSKATIYRRWSSRDELFTAAMSRLQRMESDPDTGSLGGDLEILLNELVQFLNSPGTSSVLLSFLNRAVREQELTKLQQEISQGARSSYTKVIKRAIKRGELPAGVSVRLMVDMLISPFLYQGVVEHTRVRKADIPKVVNTVLVAFGESHCQASEDRPVAGNA